MDLVSLLGSKAVSMLGAKKFTHTSKILILYLKGGTYHDKAEYRYISAILLYTANYLS